MIPSLLLILLAQWSYARTSKDVILVLDTSLSMKGFGGSDIFDRVKHSVGKYIDSLEDGDRVTFMTFDTEPRMYPTVLVDDVNDRAILKSYINMTEAKGAWTYTYRMLEQVFKKSSEISKEDTDRQAVIVVMTDALDDPPPGSRDRINIKDIAQKYGQKDLWIYFISFSNLKENARLAKIRESLEKDLKQVSKHAKVIEAGSNPEKAIGKDFQNDVRDMDSRNSQPITIVVIAIVVILLLILLLIYLKRKSGQKVTGKLEYWKSSVIDPYMTTYELGTRPARQVVIGRGIGCSLNIRDFDLEIPFSIVAVRDKSGIRMKLQANANYPIQFVNRQEGEFLEDGDIFHVANYSFKYFAA